MVGKKLKNATSNSYHSNIVLSVAYSIVNIKMNLLDTATLDHLNSIIYREKHI